MEHERLLEVGDGQRESENRACEDGQHGNVELHGTTKLLEREVFVFVGTVLEKDAVVEAQVAKPDVPDVKQVQLPVRIRVDR